MSSAKPPCLLNEAISIVASWYACFVDCLAVAQVIKSPATTPAAARVVEALVVLSNNVPFLLILLKIMLINI